ncbi:hypothetical protein NP493_7111g00000 [Ridgeia piscesae]|uniref:XLF-like coiled-coil region domain-containing protein n=1 Tax=Ridgeia piscesae TaxID=27915 RepID=A0AAD9IPW0_RIDPI|nr:hypothetical protein NP493_7111g00000 [Ridgeia piscesae]
MTTVLAGLTFNWHFQCAPASADMVSGHLVQPLVTMVTELHRQQEELYRLLTNKDKEIGDLKSQGVRVSRKHLETPLFDKSVFKDGMLASKGFVDVMQASCGEAFNRDGQRLYEDIAIKLAWLCHETQTQVESDKESLEEDETVEGSGLRTVETGQSWLNRVPLSLQSGQGASISPRKSPGKSPGKSPQKSAGSSTDPSPVKVGSQEPV